MAFSTDCPHPCPPQPPSPICVSYEHIKLCTCPQGIRSSPPLVPAGFTSASISPLREGVALPSPACPECRPYSYLPVKGICPGSTSKLAQILPPCPVAGAGTKHRTALSSCTLRSSSVSPAQIGMQHPLTSEPKSCKLPKRCGTFMAPTTYKSQGRLANHVTSLTQ